MQVIEPLDFDTLGWVMTPDRRLVPKWYGVRLERRWVSEDGRSEWRKERYPVAIESAPSVLSIDRPLTLDEVRKIRALWRDQHK